MDTWHYRLDYAIRCRGKKWPELVEKTGLSKPSVYAWRPDAKKRSSMMDGDNSAIVCDWLGIKAMWLFHGIGESGLGEIAPSNDADAVTELGQAIASKDVPQHIEQAIMTLLAACPEKPRKPALSEHEQKVVKALEEMHKNAQPGKDHILPDLQEAFINPEQLGGVDRTIVFLGDAGPVADAGQRDKKAVEK